MRLLYISHRVPYPPDRGDRIRSYHVLKYLSKLHSIGLACLASSKQEMEGAEALREFCDFVDVIPLSPVRSKVNALLGLFLKKPLTIQYFKSPHLERSIQRRLREEKFDAIMAFSSSMAQYIPFDRSVLKIMDFADVDSDKWFQYAQRTSFPYASVYRLEGQRLRRYELSVMSRVDVCTVISPEEERLLHPHPKRMALSTVPNGVDLEYFQASPEISEQLMLIFTGVMDYYANVDGVLYFHRHILPQIQDKIPEVKFTIVGSQPTRAIRRLGKSGHITVTGYVRDIRPFMRQAAVCVVPLRIARGMQNKILEAMAMGLPVVTTSRAVQGIDVCPGRDVIVADDPHEFASRVVELLSDRKRRLEMSRQARRFVESNYAWSHCLQQLDDILTFVPEDLRPAGA